MRRFSLNKVPLDELVRRFVKIALEQDRALFDDDVAAFNRLYDRMEDVENELKRRSGDQRRLLLALYDHPNMQVRIKAAKATLAIAPVAARVVLEKIKAADHHPQSLEAGMSLWNLDRGVFKPT